MFSRKELDSLDVSQKTKAMTAYEDIVPELTAEYKEDDEDEPSIKEKQVYDIESNDEEAEPVQ